MGVPWVQLGCIVRAVFISRSGYIFKMRLSALISIAAVLMGVRAQALAQDNAQPETAGLQGLYLELRQVGGSQVPVHYYFWKDGRYCDGLPSGGLEREPADFAALQSQLPCGQYRLSAQVLSLSVNPFSPARELAWRRGPGGALSLNGNALSKVPVLPGPSALAGNWSAMVSTSQMSRQLYQFRADGAYQFTSSPVSSEDGSPARQAGAYKVLGNRIELSNAPDGGASGIQNLTAYPFPGGGLMIEGTVFVR